MTKTVFELEQYWLIKKPSNRRKVNSQNTKPTTLIMFLYQVRELIISICCLNSNADIYKISDTEKSKIGLTGTKKGATNPWAFHL